ncbi:MAG: hydrogenase 2 operon protein HybA [Acidobacteria bacterium]|nr:hydrogenase 2 operon protein HybA [Acidobacteriota bacterium]
MGISRRSLFKVVAAAGAGSAASALAPLKARADQAATSDETIGMLYDSTKCTGCKACMAACNQANGISPDTETSGGRAHMPVDLNEHTLNIIKVYQDSSTGDHAYIKRQCMHCVDPACVTACMLGAMKKRSDGVVTYDPSLCIGCRYCEMGCPFNVPKFEWSKTAPKIVKCQLCRDRLALGKQPACTEVCPAGAVIFGKRKDLLVEAHNRLDSNPGRYLPKVYGEHDAGGTQVLYLACVGFDKLGLPSYGNQPVPHTVDAVQHAIYQGFVAPVALYGVLAGVIWRNRKRAGETGEQSEQP